MKFNAHSDFADELLDKIITEKDYVLKQKQIKNVKYSHVEILESNNKINKEAGNYFSIDFEHINDSEEREIVTDTLSKALKKILGKLKADDAFLIVGLGNSNISADSLGPEVASKIIVTNHLFKLYPEIIKNGTRRVSVFSPKVMGQTGLETSDLIKAIVNLYKPSFVIAIDSLASTSVSRINKVIQISDTGINPGSGIGNNRKALNYKLLKIPVIAIGVATVVSAARIVAETFELIQEKAKIKITTRTQKNIINKILDAEHLEMVVTPKEIDEEIVNLGNVIATAINITIHDNYVKM